MDLTEQTPNREAERQRRREQVQNEKAKINLTSVDAWLTLFYVNTKKKTWRTVSVFRRGRAKHFKLGDRGLSDRSSAVTGSSLPGSM